MKKLSFFMCFLFLAECVFASGYDIKQLTLAAYQGGLDKAEKALQGIKFEDLCKEEVNGLSLFKLAYENRNFEVAFLILDHLNDEDLKLAISCEGELDSGFLRDIVKYGSRRVINFVLSNCDYSNVSALESGVMRQDLDILRLLLDFKGLREEEILAKALYLSGMYGSKEIATELIMAGAKVYAVKEGSAILSAFNSGHIELANFLLDCVSNHMKDYQLRQLLLKSASEGDLNSITWLLKKGVDPNIAPDFTSPLAAAAAKGEVKAMKVLIDAGAEIDLYCGSRTALMSAAVEGQGEAIKLLISHRADVNKEIKENKGDSALIRAALNGRASAVAILLGAGASIKGFFNDKSVLMFAAEHGHVEIIKMLVEHGADVNEVCENNTALSLASAEGGVDAVRALLELGADVSKVSGYNTALICAVKEGRLLEINELIAAGADVNQVVEGNTALMTAIRKRVGIFCSRESKLESVRSLIDHGADVNFISYSYDSCLFEAVKHKDYDLIRLLVKNGADVNIGDDYSTPLEMARSLELGRVIRLLKRYGAKRTR